MFTFDSGGIIQGEDEDMSTSSAIRALEHALEMLDKAASSEKPWQDASELLDVTVAALDDGALALRNEAKAAEIRRLSEMIIESREKVLGAAAKKALEFEPRPVSIDKEALLVYASHTGTSKNFAMHMAYQLGLDENGATNMKDLTLKVVARHKRVIFICSTFGLGRPPRDGEAFFSALQLARSRSIRPFDGVEFCVAALGNSSFGNFCAFGHSLARELCSLGATEILPLQTLDSNRFCKNYVKPSIAFDEWMKKVLTSERIRLI